MATTRVISLPFNINEKLKEEENASGLISQLLEDYYKKIEMPEEDKSILIQMEEAAKKEIAKKQTERLREVLLKELGGQEDAELAAA